MDGNFNIKVGKFDNVSLQSVSTLVIDDGNTRAQITLEWKNLYKIVLQYLQQADDEERTKIWHELYDDLSYEELEAKYLEASNEADNLKAEIESLRQSKDRKVFDY